MKSFIQYVIETSQSSKLKKEQNNLANLKIRLDALKRGNTTWVKNDNIENVEKSIKHAEHGVNLYGNANLNEYLSEDDIVLGRSVSRSQAAPHYRNFIPLDSESIKEKYDKIKTFKHKGETYHLYQSRDNNFEDKMYRLMHSGKDGNINEVGTIGILSNPSRQLAHDKIQTQLNRKYEAISLEPVIHPSHAGTGLVSKIYKMIGNHIGRDIISDYSQTRGSQNVWTELSKSGKVTGVHTYKGFTPFEYDPKNEDHVDKIYRGGENALLHYSHVGRVIL